MKASEKRLLFALLGMLVLGLVVIGSGYYFDRRDELLVEKSTLENEWITIETLFEEKDTWEMRAAWLDQNQPKFTNTEEIDQAIFKEAEALDADGVETSKQALLPTLTTPEYVQAGVSLAATGELGDVFRWIYALNRPESFRVIRNIKIAPDKEDAEKVTAQFELLRWYAPKEE
jgi:hypothetical protein